MKLYHFPVAPNPSRVRIYANEKNLPLEQVQVSLGEGEHKSPAHLARNPRAALPVLDEYANLQRWYADFKLRPSAQT